MLARRQFLIGSASISGWAIASRISTWAASVLAPRSTGMSASNGTSAVNEGDATLATGDRQHPHVSHALLIFDPALPSGRAFAAQARARPGEYKQFVMPLEGDVGALWYRAILPQLSSGAPIPFDTIRGWTSHADFFVLSTLATTVGLSISTQAGTPAPQTPATAPLVAAVPSGPREVVWNFTLAT
jgi:hypothetical protein